MQRSLLLVDTTGYLFRAHHAVGDLRTRTNQPTGAMMVTLKMLIKLQRLYPAQHIACVMDAGGKNFRHAIDSTYKANRPPLMPELKAQIEPLQQFILALGWPLIVIPGVEADDVIATLTKQGVAAGMDVVIASSDKDLMQLVNDQVILFDGMKNQAYDTPAVQAKFAVTPTQMVDYLALVGDQSDNIAGVARVGKKTAAQWLDQFGHLEALIANAEHIRGVVGDSLRRAISDGQLERSRQLVTLKDDVSLSQTIETLSLKTPDKAAWHTLCRQYEFHQLRTLLEETTTVVKPPQAVTITDSATLKQWVEKIQQQGQVAIATEITDGPIRQASLIGLSLALPDAAAYLPFAHTDLMTPQLSQQLSLALLRPILEEATIRKIFHNGKNDWHVFANHGIHLQGILEDTQIAAYSHDVADDNHLEALVEKHIDFKIIKYSTIVDGKKDRHIATVPIDIAAPYAADKATAIWHLHQRLSNTLSAPAKQLYTTLDRPLLPVLAAMERRGMRIDTAWLKHFSDDMRERLQILEKQAYDCAGESFNLNSPRQLETVLFDKIGATPLHKTTQGARSTDEKTLARLADDHPLAAIILKHRTLSKLLGTYAEKLPQLVSPQSGRIHTTFNQTAVITGRLSSSSPNLQNIPIRSEEGRRIRRAFIAADGHVLVSADYSQVELRLMAHIAADEALCAAFMAGVDVHQQTAAEIFGVPLENVSSAQRHAAKAINFGLIYGMSAFGLARNLNIDQQQAQVYIERYFSRYPGIASFMERTRQMMKTNNTVETITGRRITLLSTRGNRQAMERAAINAPIQGSAADIIKMAMLAVEQWLHQQKMRSRLLLQVHDELILEAPHDEVDAVCAELPRLMSNDAISLPLVVNVNHGSNWDEAH